jgi:crossover junction endodeoxyribonuclease RusA
MVGPLEVLIDLYPPDYRRRDADNALKSCLDSLEHGGAYLDDSQIVDLRVRKRSVLPGGKAIVTINFVEGA